MMRKTPMLVVSLLYLLGPSLQVIDFVQAQLFASATDIVNYGASIFAYNWLLLNVILALKIPLLQRALPYDFRIRTHIVTSVLMVAFLVWHAVYYLVLNPKQINLVTWTLMGTFVLFLVLALLWVPLPGLGWLHKRQRSYDALKLVHKTLFLVVAGLAYVHIIDAKIIGVVSPWSGLGFLGLFVAAVVLFLATRLHNRLLPVLKVVSVTTRGSVTSLKLTGHRRLRYRAGQFAFLRFLHPALRNEEHPFSFTSADHEVEFAIKNVGDYTSRLSVLAPGDRVKVNGGFGAFRPGFSRPLVLIGTGIGAAPMVSLLKDLVRNPRPTPVVCLISASSRDDLVEPEWWDSLPSLLPNLTLRILLADQGAPLFSQALFRELLETPRRFDYFLCSSGRVRSILLGILSEMGIPPRQIHYEAFTLG